MFKIIRSMSKPYKLGLSVVAMLAVAGVAVAYWTGAGTGNTTAALSSGGTITLTPTIASGLAPGLSRTVALTATNPTSSAIRVGTVSLATVTADASHAACAGTDFAMDPITENQSIPAAATTGLTVPGVLTMADLAGVNQDACKGATLTLTFTSN